MPLQVYKEAIQELFRFARNMRETLNELQLSIDGEEESDSRDALDHNIVLDDALDAEFVG